MGHKHPTNYLRNKWSKAVKVAAGYKCAYCGSADNLESHHIKPLCDHPELELEVSNGVCLCHDCHVKAHGGTFWKPTGNTLHAHPWNRYTQEEIAAVQAFVLSLAQ